MLEKTSTGTRTTGFYRGIVKAHGKNGKCKIFWPGVSPASWIDDDSKIPLLPDAEQAAPIFASSNKDNDGVFCYPAVGAVVWGFFANEDPNFPVYFASTVGIGSNANVDAEIRSDKKEEVFGGDSYKTAIVKLGTMKMKVNGIDSSIEIESDIEDSGTKSKIVFDKTGVTIASNKSIAIEGANVSIKSHTQTEVASDQLVKVLGGGVDGDGKRVPGSVYVIANFPVIYANGGLATICAENTGKTYW